MAGAEIPWLAAAVTLHVAAQLSRALAWRGILAAAWPGVTRRRACAWHLCGAGLSGVLSARGGDGVRMALARRELPGATWPALGGTLAAEGSFEAVCGVGLGLFALWLGVGTLAGPSPYVAAAVAAALVAAAGAAASSRRVRRIVTEVARGAAVMRCPRRWLREVLPFQLAGRGLRLASASCFLLAFGLPVAPAVVIAACAAQGSGAMIPLPGAGPAAVGAALLVAVPLAAGGGIDHAAVAGLALVWPTALTVVGVTLSVALLVSLSGAHTPRAAVRAALALRPHASPAAP